MAKRVGGRGSAPDPAGGAYDASPDPLVGWGGDTPLQTLPLSAPSALRFSRFRRWILGAIGASNFATSALNFCVPIVVNLRNDHCSKHQQHGLNNKICVRRLTSAVFAI